VCLAAPARAFVRRVHRAPLELNVFGPARPLTDTAWLTERVGRNRRYDLGDDALLGLLERYVEPEREYTPEWSRFWRGRYGRKTLQFQEKLSWFGTDDAATPAFALPETWSEPALRGPAFAEPFDFSRAEVLPDWSLEVPAPEPEFWGITQRKYCPRWKAPRAVSVVRYDGAEWARLPLVDCEGAIAPDVLDRLSVLARPPGAPKPDVPLPLQADDDALGGEWLPRVKLLNPRLIWAVQKIAEAFPNRSIFIMSGYRPGAHSSYHQKGRALDLYVTGVENADLFRFCRTLNDVGCGFYPNNKCVHGDVRPFGSHHAAWVDVSMPGAPSEYVTSWPGVFGSASALSADGSGEAAE